MDFINIYAMTHIDNNNNNNDDSCNVNTITIFFKMDIFNVGK